MGQIVGEVLFSEISRATSQPCGVEERWSKWVDLVCECSNEELTKKDNQAIKKKPMLGSLPDVWLMHLGAETIVAHTDSLSVTMVRQRDETRRMELTESGAAIPAVVAPPHHCECDFALPADGLLFQQELIQLRGR